MINNNADTSYNIEWYYVLKKTVPLERFIAIIIPSTERTRIYIPFRYRYSRRSWPRLGLLAADLFVYANILKPLLFVSNLSLNSFGGFSRRRRTHSSPNSSTRYVITSPSGNPPRLWYLQSRDEQNLYYVVCLYVECAVDDDNNRSTDVFEERGVLDAEPHTPSAIFIHEN